MSRAAILPDIVFSFVLRPLNWELGFERQRDDGYIGYYVRLGPFWLGCSFVAPRRLNQIRSLSANRRSSGQ